MKNFILLTVILSITFFSLFCGGSSRTIIVKQLASFEVKADLATRQLYQTLAEEKHLDTKINVFIKCSKSSEDEIKILRKLKAKVESTSGDILSVTCKAKVLPELADLDFVEAIESAKNVKLR